MKRRERANKSPFKDVIGSSKSSNADSMPPVFSFEKMVVGSGYSVSCCDDQERAALSSKLFELSQMTWQDIKNAPRHGLGSEKIDRAALSVPIPHSVTDDVTFLALRYNGKKAMICYRDERVLHLLFLDHNFSVYNHGLFPVSTYGTEMGL